jgi:hypothetical protein
MKFRLTPARKRPRLATEPFLFNLDIFVLPCVAITTTGRAVVCLVAVFTEIMSSFFACIFVRSTGGKRTNFFLNSRVTLRALEISLVSFVIKGDRLVSFADSRVGDGIGSVGNSSNERDQHQSNNNLLHFLSSRIGELLNNSSEF